MNKDDPIAIGIRIKNLRERKDLTQEQLAEKLGYKSKSSIAHIEKGRPIPRSMVAKLSKILDTSSAYIMGWVDENGNPYDEQKNIAPTPKSKDELRNWYDELSNAEKLEMLNYLRYLKYKKDNGL